MADDEMNSILKLLKMSGYSDKAIEYYLKKVNVGEIKEPDASFAYQGPCGDSMQIYLKIRDDVIGDVRFQVVGCAGASVSGSALTEIIKGMKLEEAKKITEEDIIGGLNGVPRAKFHCVCLAFRTLRKAIESYEKKSSIS
ncbi:MAG: iron-sulfur cluster assembly scaffold protein [Candidatus Altiarchaeales archaeon]|nr:iron-sulfur cluster assembly scaffold protein [Candidatus Altiarchaeales archaeon]